LTKKGEIHIKIIAERLKEARNEKAKTQSDLAELLNISRAAFGEYERGNNLPPIDKLVIIAKELEVSLDWLAGIENQKQIDLNIIRAAALEFEIKNFNQDGEAEKYRQQRKTLEAEIEKLKRKRANIFDLMEEGSYTRADFLERKGIVDEQLEKIGATLEALEEPTQHEIKLKSATFAQVIQSLNDPEINIAKKNRLLKSVISRIDYEYDGEKLEMDIFFK